MARIPNRVVGEAVQLNIATDYDITGSTVTARVSLNDGTASSLNGTLGSAVDGEIKTATLIVTAATLTAAGWLTGTISITHPSAPWSPDKLNFEFGVDEAV